jgi:hypothetical protein
LTERPSPISIARLFRALLVASLALSALFYFVWSWRWPLVGDASLIHYIGFLSQRGWAPYRQLGDMNMPGSFLIEMAAMRIFGMGDLAWRFFDFSLLTLASAAFFVVARNSRAPFVTASSSASSPPRPSSSSPFTNDPSGPPPPSACFPASPRPSNPPPRC